MYQIESKYQPGIPLVYAQEKSDFLSRQCCPAGTRGYEMDLHLHGGSFLLPHLRFQKPFACPILCACRPEMDVYDTQNNYLAGRIVNNFRPFGMNYTVFDSNNQPVLSIHGNDCQWG